MGAWAGFCSRGVCGTLIRCPLVCAFVSVLAFLQECATQAVVHQAHKRDMRDTVAAMQRKLQSVRKQGGRCVCGARGPFLPPSPPLTPRATWEEVLAAAVGGSGWQLVVVGGSGW